MNDHESAAPYVDRAVLLRQDRVSCYPDLPNHRCDLGVSLANHSQHENSLGHGAEAIAW